ncbi:MAG: tetratricopeptide repeat protein, partial [Bacteroidota bacterium]
MEYSSSYDTNLYRLKTKLELAKTLSDVEGVGQANIELGDFFYKSKLYSEATKHYQEFLDVNENVDTIFVNVQNKMALINLNLNQYKEAKKHATIGQNSSNQIKYPLGNATSKTLMGSVEEKQGNYEKALDYQRQSLVLFKSLNDSIGLAKTNESIGSIYEDLEKYDLAFKYFSMASDYSRGLKDSDLKISIINNVGDIYRKTKSYELAIKETQRALDLAVKTNNQAQQVSALKDLAKVNADIGEFEKAYEYLNNQRIVKEEELVNSNAQLITTMGVLYGLKEKQAEVELLSKQNEINKAEKKVILVIGIAVLLALVSVLMYWKKRRNHDRRIFDYKQKLLQAEIDRKTAEETALNKEIDIKISSLANYSLNLAHKNKLLSDVSKTLTKLNGRNSVLVNKKLKELAAEIDFDIKKSNEWAELTSYFSQI